MVRQTFSDQTRAEPVDAEALFLPAAARYRARMRLFVTCVVAGAALSGASLLLPDAALPWLAVPGCTLVAAGLLLFFTLPGLRCPACSNLVEAYGPHCPVCGAAAIEPGTLSRPRTCKACGARLGGYKYRSFRIHYCQHCGTLVSRPGV